jgi:hypothetical protein
MDGFRRASPDFLEVLNREGLAASNFPHPGCDVFEAACLYSFASVLTSKYDLDHLKLANNLRMAALHT